MNAAPGSLGEPAAWSRRAALAYGGLGAPLAFVALPLYVQLPQHYAQVHGVALATLGALLLAVRCLDALVDPLLGRWADRLLARGGPSVWWLLGASAVLVALGFVQLFFAPALGAQALLAWCGGWLALTCAGWSLASVLHQAWGARLGGGELAQSRWVSAREGAGLVGVVAASLLPSLAGLAVTAVVLCAALAIGWLALRWAPAPPADHVTGHATGHATDCAPDPTADPGVTPVRPVGAAPSWQGLLQPWQLPAFRRLLAVYLVNGVAAAVPATLVLFFIRDRLQAPAWEGAFLALYFVSGVASLPAWVRAVRRWGAVRAWALGMGVAVAGFAGAIGLGAGDVALFAGVCLASGLALGADLALPATLLAEVVATRRRSAGAGGYGGYGGAGADAGLFFGWWNAAAKLNLALAAGLVLPLLGWLGYVPGAATPAGLDALAWVYAGLPCALKLVALALLLRWHEPAIPAVPAADSRPTSPVAVAGHPSPEQGFNP